MSVDCREKLHRNAGFEHALSGKNEQQPNIVHEIEVDGLAAVADGEHRVTGLVSAVKRKARADVVLQQKNGRDHGRRRARFTRMTPPDATSG